MSFQKEKRHIHRWVIVGSLETHEIQACRCGERRELYTCKLCKGQYHREGHHKCKRGVTDIAEYLELKQLINFVLNCQSIPYVLNCNLKALRDRALLSLFVLTGLRISEILSLRRYQFCFDMLDFIEIRNVKILKRRKEPIFKDFGLPKEGTLAPLTMLVLEHFETSKRAALFDINRTTAWRIVKHMTGKWCHYFRSQRLSYLVNKFRSTVIVADMQGIKSPATIAHYYKGGWKHHKEELKE